ncbi:copper chaperone PCu(A)C [Streptomyces sp. NPDC059002]|uniref:copper chaperone PCu(A)C n=1 Tax=Streptomyces sp. NPDC059002 TaxID=3346690 RepID=UPI0036CA9BDB
MNHRTTTHRRRVLAGGAIALAAALTLAGCGDDSGPKAAKKPEIKVSGAFVPEPTMDDMAAGFLTLDNAGAADKLTSATSDIAGDVTLHSSKNGTMKEEKSFDVPADGELEFTRGGNHLMLEKLKRKPKQGEKVALTLHFQKSDPITIEVPVKEATYNPKQQGGSAHGSHKSH